MERYTAGFNIPGFLPDSEPVKTETFDEARDYLLSELDEHLSIVNFTLDMRDDEEDGEEDKETQADLILAKEAVSSWDSPNSIQVSHWSYWIEDSEV